MREMGAEMDVEEDGETFEENALIKAEALMRKTGCAALADDSGLIVDALGGRPGVHSARYAGVHGDDEANNDKLLEELAGVPEGKRAARFVSSICVCLPGGRCAVFEGVCPGRVGFVRRGTNGFGYDPLFIPDEVGVPGGGGTAENTQGRSYAELSAAEKDAISHRGRAMERMEAELARFLADGSVIGMTCGNACITVADKAEG
jgi:XTP/dITP diphosphohydrolase